MLTLYRFWFKIGSLCWPRWAARQAFTLFITPLAGIPKPLPPFFGEALRVELMESGDRCVGWRWNPGGKKRILILHGFSSSARNFAHLVEALVNKGAEVIAFDAPAHGSSEGKTIHSLRYRKLIQAIREKWGPIEGYVAHSFGGLSLSLALEEMPPRGTDRVVLIAPATETRSALHQLQSTLRLSDKILSHINELIQVRSGQPVSWFSVNRVVSNLDNPILWVHDRNDEITPLSDVQTTLLESKHHLRFILTEGLGHRRIYRDPDVCKQVIEFLTA